MTSGLTILDIYQNIIKPDRDVGFAKKVNPIFNIGNVKYIYV